MDEADRLCDRIGIVDEGALVAEGTPARLKATVGSQSLDHQGPRQQCGLRLHR
jgi:ABC-2 type transport system ATP-binding protein